MSFIEKEMNYFMFMQLRDLAFSFMKKEVDIQYNQVSFLDIHAPKITISSFWENRTTKHHLGEKTDIYLRALGNYTYSDRNALLTFVKQIEKNRLPSFMKQLVSLLEDLRLEEKIQSLRPGTSKAFDFRRKQYADFFQDQLKVNRTRSFDGDILFSFLALSLLEGMEFKVETVLEIPEETMNQVKVKLFTAYECKHTSEVIDLSWGIYHLVSDYVKMDMINPYFTLPKIKVNRAKEMEEDESFDETLPTWSRKRKKETEETFMQFDDVDGEHQDMKFSETPRESESTDQVMASVQGQSQQTDFNDHSEASSEKIDSEDEDGFNKGKANRFAVAIEQELEAITASNRDAFEDFKQKTLLEKKKLVKLLTDLLERKRENNFRRLHYGKLDKKLVRFFTQDNPKMFVKKDDDDHFDCSFTLLVDCSSSMMNKMEKTKETMVLFHETLRQMDIPHSVIGFWEDGMDSDETYQPNYFHEVISFENSLQSKVGPHLMQLQPEEDNRDGFAIRYVAEKLTKQIAQHKFLLVLTDGKPAAFDYFQNGVMDTKQAIQEVEKKGIHTIGIQMDSQEEQQEKIMESMYNNHYLIVDQLEELPAQFASVLKKLIMIAS
ncbi:vWA domain-containing protein [Salinibacillus xinjiangensis]|uniref:VWA domain-containing protein n=1 Tax=Salinibacillus xinjiangensis TaxID=1229268 RepID=A0A6G1X4A3_9BACI|nr:VWA domain-containing protein [Salinibacillus xinjiangensis]MRG85823.1 VWA domain-containing protein [Salinibacillus xinjiangensis]